MVRSLSSWEYPLVITLITVPAVKEKQLCNVIKLHQIIGIW